MNLFFDQKVAANVSEFLLNADETHHASKVLRLKQGNEIHITDGNGSIFKGQILSLSGKEARIGNIQLAKRQQRPFSVHLALSPVKNLNRIEWLLEKVTEIGVSEISFVHCHRTQRTRLRYDRLQKIVVEAMKQSMNSFLPKMNELVDLETFLQEKQQGQCFIGYCETDKEQSLPKLYKPGTDATILIGPEGDFTPDEVHQARENGYTETSLGPSRLRTETAALVAVTAFRVLSF